MDEVTIQVWTDGWLARLAALLHRPLRPAERTALRPLARRMAEAPKNTAAMQVVWADIVAVLPSLRGSSIAARR